MIEFSPSEEVKIWKQSCTLCSVTGRDQYQAQYKASKWVHYCDNFLSELPVCIFTSTARAKMCSVLVCAFGKGGVGVAVISVVSPWNVNPL